VTALLPRADGLVVNYVDVRFSAAIEAATFTTGDVSITTPLGGAVAVTGVVPLAADTFRVSFASPAAAGTYGIVVGPQVADLLGNPMNTDGDSVNGEAADAFAGTFAVVMLTFIAPPLASVALSFGPPEYFALTFMGLTLVTSLAGESMLKGIMSGVFGLIVACVGIDAVSGEERFTFGNLYLLDGMGFIGVAVGLFAVAEVLLNLEEPMEQVFLKADLRLRSLFPNLQDWKDSFWPIWRSSILGFFIGVLPGAGATIASFMAYALEKKLSQHPEKFGTGVIEGVAAPEGANNAAAGGAMVPLLTLGIPGSGTTAVLLGALLIHGLRPGPLLFQNNPGFVWGVIASMYIGNVMLLILNLPMVGVWASLLRVPYRILMPLIVTISAVGVFATDNNVFDMWVMFAFGIIGYLMRKLDFPAAPAVLGLVLGPMVERSLRQSLTISHGSLSIFFTRPISAVLTIAALLSLFAPLMRGVWEWRKKAVAAAQG
jgi:putative tricarboxylic transport membrane protein